MSSGQEPLKQIFTNQKQLTDSLKPVMAMRQSATGIVLGRRDGEKAYVYDVMTTPDPEESQEDIRKLGGNN